MIAYRFLHFNDNYETMDECIARRNESREDKEISEDNNTPFSDCITDFNEEEGNGEDITIMNVNERK
jgi:hypothetical protein